MALDGEGRGPVDDGTSDKAHSGLALWIWVAGVLIFAFALLFYIGV